MAKKASSKKKKAVAHYGHDDATRKNIPSAEVQMNVRDEVREAVQVAYDRRDPDLDPQLVWRGKDDGPLDVSAPPLYIQEKVHPKALIDELLRESRTRAGIEDEGYHAADLFSDFNGLPEEAKSTDYYRHDGHWSNRMILGDALQVMASLAEREGLRGKVQCIYIDPPYGIKFNSNFQWSTTSRDVKDGKAEHLTREPEQVRAFRDTWKDGIHSYLSYLRDRLIVARDLLTESGSVFVQIGDENVHRVRAVMDEVFGEENCVTEISLVKTAAQTSQYLPAVNDYLLWYAKDRSRVKYRPLLRNKSFGVDGAERYSRGITLSGETCSLGKEITRGIKPLPKELRAYSKSDLTSQRQGRSTGPDSAMGFEFRFQGNQFRPSGSRGWSTTVSGLERLVKAARVEKMGKNITYRRMLNDFSAYPLSNNWDNVAGVMNRSDPKVYVVQTSTSAVARCLLMTTDPGDLVLDPTCGSGTTAFVAEQWGRRWITCDTSRVALALARARIMGARYPFYLLADSREGQQQEAKVTRTAPSEQPAHGNLRQGFVYERVPHITLKSIANNAEIDVIYDDFQTRLEPLREKLNAALKESWEEWEIPRETDESWPSEVQELHAAWWEQRIARQKEIDASIAAKADSEYLYDRPYEDKTKVRVAGPFTVESASPHRMLAVGADDELIDTWDRVAEEGDSAYGGKHQDFASVILENLRTAGVQQSQKEDRITFDSVAPIVGEWVCAEGRYTEGESDDGPVRRAGIFIGPEFGTVARPDLVRAARECGDMGFDLLIACGFNFDAHSTEFEKLGALPVLKARMNADLHMATDLKNTGKGNLFVVFGEPDIAIEETDDGNFQVRLHGVDVFKPTTGKVESSDAKDIACWMIDTDYNEESFFVRHAYFLGQNDPYKALKTTLKAEIDEEAWSSLNRDLSRAFPKPTTGRIAVKVINHLGDEVMKVFSIS